MKLSDYHYVSNTKKIRILLSVISYLMALIAIELGILIFIGINKNNTEEVAIIEKRSVEYVEVTEPELSYTEEDLEWLSAVMFCEAGSEWITDEEQMLFGQVVINRVNSPEFPNTIKEVINQPGQYHPEKFINQIPDQRTINNAIKLLEGDGPDMPSSVIFQDNRPLGNVWKKIEIDHLGTTYFCYSPNLEKYN